MLDGDYTQTLTFRNDGKVVPGGGGMNDHVLRQCESPGFEENRQLFEIFLKSPGRKAERGDFL